MKIIVGNNWIGLIMWLFRLLWMIAFHEEAESWLKSPDSFSPLTSDYTSHVPPPWMKQCQSSLLDSLCWAGHVCVVSVAVEDGVCLGYTRLTQTQWGKRNLWISQRGNCHVPYCINMNGGESTSYLYTESCVVLVCSCRGSRRSKWSEHSCLCCICTHFANVGYGPSHMYVFLPLSLLVHVGEAVWKEWCSEVQHWLCTKQWLLSHSSVW